MNFQFSSDEQAFAHEVREFLRERIQAVSARVAGNHGSP